MAKYIVKNILFEVETAVEDTFVAVPQVATLELPQSDTEEVEVTTLDNDGVREFLQGLTDGGEATLELVFDPATHFTATDSVWKLFKSGAVRRWRAGLPTGIDLLYGFTAYVKNASLASLTPGQALRLNATLRVSGAAGDFEAVAP